MVSQNGGNSENGKPRVGRKVTGKPLFDLGLIVGTKGASEVMRKHELHPLLLVAMHASGIWGTVDKADALANDMAVLVGARILSAYTFGEDRLWVITEADRSQTTILTPDEY